MSREAPVRFREGLGVKFPRATRLVVLHESEDVVRESQEAIAEGRNPMPAPLDFVC
jgi:hypothetical protein